MRENPASLYSFLKTILISLTRSLIHVVGTMNSKSKMLYQPTYYIWGWMCIKNENVDRYNFNVDDGDDIENDGKSRV